MRCGSRTTPAGRGRCQQDVWWPCSALISLSGAVILIVLYSTTRSMKLVGADFFNFHSPCLFSDVVEIGQQLVKGKTQPIGSPWVNTWEDSHQPGFLFECTARSWNNPSSKNYLSFYRQVVCAFTSRLLFNSSTFACRAVGDKQYNTSTLLFSCVGLGKLGAAKQTNKQSKTTVVWCIA